MNEHQLAIGETTFGGKRELKSDVGIIDCPELYRLVLERAKTAREAIQIADQLTKDYGYNDYGEAFTFADKDEVWFFEILGPGRGKKGAVWAAVRIPDDEVAVSANAPRIRKLNLKDPDNYMASANVYSLAEELGWWSAKSGEPFEFCTVYGSRSSLGSRRREWRALSRLAPSLRLDPNAEHYPLSVKPEKKLSVKDVFDIFRDTYEGTPYDMTRNILKVDRDGKAVKNPIANPFMNNDYLDASRSPPSARSPASAPPTCTVTQSRKWLPDPVGGVVWLGYDNPMTTPHTAVLHRDQPDAGQLHGGRPGEVPPRLRVVGVPPGQPARVPALAGHGEGHREGLAADGGEGLGRPGGGRGRGRRALQAGPGEGPRVPHGVLAQAGQRRRRRLLEARRGPLGQVHESVLSRDSGFGVRDSSSQTDGSTSLPV